MVDPVKMMKKTQLSFLLMPLVAVIILSGDPQPKEDLAETVQYLLDFVKNSECTFIRNGREYTSQKAASHMERKYKRFRERIKTPEDFIRLAATKSTMSGKPYRVRTKDGKTVLTSQWLLEALNGYRKPKDCSEDQEEPDSTAL